MSRLIFIVGFIVLFAGSPSAAQDDSGHVILTTYYKALPEQTALYNKYGAEWGFPVYDEWVRRGVIVWYRIVQVWSGTGEYTHAFIREYENWDAVDTQVDADEVCQAVFGMTCDEKRAEIGIDDLAKVRVFVRNEIAGSIRP